MNNAPIWIPNNETIQKSHIKKFIGFLNLKFSLNLDSYDELYQFSIQEKEKFWSALWDFSAIIGSKGDVILSLRPRGTLDGPRLDPAVKPRDDTRRGMTHAAG